MNVFTRKPGQHDLLVAYTPSASIKHGDIVIIGGRAYVAQDDADSGVARDMGLEKMSEIQVDASLVTGTAVVGIPVNITTSALVVTSAAAPYQGVITEVNSSVVYVQLL
ncbi:MAG: hypothetical protein LBJ41_01840 [Treponema sp.]|jgi:predicted RecA/RadA family phage recombinase|nr:hypothetical protein [Treponema sp.]